MKKYVKMLIVFMLGTVAGEIIMYTVYDSQANQHDVQLEKACRDLMRTIWDTNSDYALDVLTETDEYLTLDSILTARSSRIHHEPDTVVRELMPDKPTKHFEYDR